MEIHKPHLIFFCRCSSSEQTACYTADVPALLKIPFKTMLTIFVVCIIYEYQRLLQ